MKKSYYFLFTIILLCRIKITQCGDASLYENKTLQEIQSSDCVVKRIVEESWWDIKQFITLKSLFKKPSYRDIQRIKKNINQLNERIGIIEKLLLKARKDLVSLNSQSGCKFGNDLAGAIVVTVMLFPWLTLFSCIENNHSYTIKQKIKTMEKTKKSMESIIEELDIILKQHFS